MFTNEYDNGDYANVYNMLQTMPLCPIKCNTIGLSSVCIATAFVTKVEYGERADVPKVELGKQKVKTCWTHTERAIPSKMLQWYQRITPKGLITLRVTIGYGGLRQVIASERKSNVRHSCDYPSDCTNVVRWLTFTCDNLSQPSVTYCNF